MAQALTMLHARDPKETLFEEVGGAINDVELLGSTLLVAIYVRPTKTASGIYLTEKTTDEDLYQGKVGLVLRLGPIAFKEDETHRFGGVVPKVGDWVLLNVGETWPFSLGKTRCRIVEDVSVKAILARPDLAW